MRFLTGQRLEHHCFVGAEPRPGTDELFAVRVLSNGSRKPSGLEPGKRRCVTLERENGRPHEQLEPDQGRDRIAREAEDKARAAHAERDRLPGLDRNTPEHFVDAELPLDSANEVVRPDGHAAGVDQHVVLQAACNRRAVDPLVVRDRRLALHASTRRAKLSGEDQPICLVDLAGVKRLAGPAKLRSRCKHGGPRLRMAGYLRHPGGRHGPQVCGAQPNSRLDHDRSRPKITATRANVRTIHHRVRNLDLVVTFDNVLEGDDGVGALGNDPACGDRHCLAGRKRSRSRPPGRDAEGDRQLAGRIGGANGEPVHRRARKRGQVRGGRHRLGKHSAGGVVERDPFGRQRAHAFEDQPLRIPDREQVCRHRPIRYARRVGSAAVISVVVPVHNEERTLGLLYEELESALQPQGEPWEVVFVDDGSKDGSFGALTRLHSARDNVRVVRLRRNFGKAAALAAGFAQAQGEVMVTIDADLQDDPAEIPRLLAKLDEGFDLVSGWKAHRRDPLSRRVLSRIFNWVTGRVSGLRLHDMNCGLKAYRAEAVRGLRLYGELHRFIPVLAHYHGHRIAELPVNHRPREHGGSRYGVERYLRGFLDLLTVSFIGRYRYRPLHLFGGLGLLLGLLGFGVLVYLTALKIGGHAIGRRPLLILGVLLVVVGLQFFSLGLISELITSQHEERAGTHERTELHVEEILS